MKYNFYCQRVAHAPNKMQKQLADILERVKNCEDRTDLCVRTVQALWKDFYGGGAGGSDDRDHDRIDKGGDGEAFATAITEGGASRSRSRSRSRGRGRSRSRSRKRGKRGGKQQRMKDEERRRIHEHGDGRSVYIHWPDGCKSEPHCEPGTPEHTAARKVLRARFAPYSDRGEDGIRNDYLWPTRKGRMIGRIEYYEARDYERALDAAAELRQKHDYMCGSKP